MPRLVHQLVVLQDQHLPQVDDVDTVWASCTAGGLVLWALYNGPG